VRTIKISVISQEIPLCKKIKRILENLEFFQVDYSDNIEECIAKDIIIIDMDCFNKANEKWVIELVKRSKKSRRFILLKEVYNLDSLKNVSILPKPVTEMGLMDSICNSLLRDLDDVINENSK